MYWYGHVEACGSSLLRHGLNFSTACCTMWPNSVEKDWKHALMQKVVTLNTCCDIACLTFQLPHQFFSEPLMATHNWLFSEPPTFERTQQPSVRWKSLAIHKLLWWHQVGWASGLQFVFQWDNANNQKYVRIILLKMTFFDFPRYRGYIWQVRWTVCKIFMLNFLRI